jgi:hypothetical protein
MLRCFLRKSPPKLIEKQLFSLSNKTDVIEGIARE